MRNRLVVIALCTATSVLLAATAQLQPLNVKIGLWRLTKAIKWTDLPPQMAAMMKSAPQMTSYDSCVTTKDLNTNPFANGSGDDCTLHSRAAQLQGGWIGDRPRVGMPGQTAEGQ